MRVNLTDTYVGRIQAPAAGQVEYWDAKVSGLYLRVSQGGGMAWMLKYRAGKQARRMKLGTASDFDVAAARKFARNLKMQVQMGGDPATESKTAREEATFKELSERYMEHAEAHKKARSVEEDKGLLRRYAPESWRTMRLSAITSGVVAKLHAEVGQHHGHYAANGLARLLRHMFNLARDWELTQSENPAARLKLFKEHGRERFLSRDELARVVQALDNEPDWRWKAYFPLALMLGTRRSELLSARWEHVDLEERVIRLPATKSGAAHLLPLPTAAVRMLESLPSRGASEWVFMSPDSKAGHLVEPKSAWMRIRKAAGVPDVRIHDLRHSLASWLTIGGFNLQLVGKVLNHSQLSTTARYSHLNLEPQRLALEANAQLMFGQMLEVEPKRVEA